MPKSISSNHIVIPRSEYKKILRWALSKNEIGAICFGVGNKVEVVVRIANALHSKKNHYAWENKCRKNAIEWAKARGLAIVAELHSHPHRHHLQMPSNDDLKYFTKNRPHIIIFPIQKIAKCWILKNEIKKTLECELSLKIIK